MSISSVPSPSFSSDSPPGPIFSTSGSVSGSIGVGSVGPVGGGVAPPGGGGSAPAAGSAPAKGSAGGTSSGGGTSKASCSVIYLVI